jgi:hypothetical protein
MSWWLLQVLVAVDQLANALLLRGWADETISARAWRQRHKRRWAAAVWVIDALFRLVGQRGHCRQAHESELLRRQAPPASRQGGSS